MDLCFLVFLPRCSPAEDSHTQIRGVSKLAQQVTFFFNFLAQPHHVTRTHATKPKKKQVPSEPLLMVVTWYVSFLQSAHMCNILSCFQLIS